MTNNDITQLSERALSALKQLEQQLEDFRTASDRLRNDLNKTYEENKAGLGPHDRAIGKLIQKMDLSLQSADKPLQALQVKIHAALLIRVRVTGDAQSVIRMNVSLYSAYCRKMRKPSERTGSQDVKGKWDGGVFYPDPQWVPSRTNPDHLNVSEIRAYLKADYNIFWNGIPFQDGYADFSSVAAAWIPARDILKEHLKQYPDRLDPEGFPDRKAIFSRRDINMRIADAIAAERQIPIPGLKPGYTAEDLRKWRAEHKFCWDESPANGYLLVPRIVHDNISHTGLVAIEKQRPLYERRFTGAVAKRANLSGRLSLNLARLCLLSHKKISLLRPNGHFHRSV